MVESNYKILACLALSPRLTAVTGEAAALGRALGSKLYFVHAGEPTEEHRLALEKTIAEQCRGLSWSLSIIEGRPELVVRDEAERVGADLVLAGSLKREGILKEIFGSVSRRIVRSVRQSVILLTEPLPFGSAFQRVVVNVPLDKDPEDCFNFAMDFCRRAATKKLYVVYAAPYQERLAQRYGDEERRSFWQSYDMERLNELIRRAHAPDMETIPIILNGADGLETVEYAVQTDADLVIFPAPSRELGLWDRFFNHPTEVVMQQLPKSILFYRNATKPPVREAE